MSTPPGSLSARSEQYIQRAGWCRWRSATPSARLAPSVPTVAEAGYKDVVVGAWNGFFAPKGTDAGRSGQAAQHPAERDPDVARGGREARHLRCPAGGRRGPSCWARPIASDYEVMGKVIRDLGVRPTEAAPADVGRPTSSTLGRDVPQVECAAKVLGRAQYAGDPRGRRHACTAPVLRSPYPHARIVAIDTSAALALPGVKAVLTGADARAMWGVHQQERRILAEGVVRFAGEEVAAVAAASERSHATRSTTSRSSTRNRRRSLTPESARRGGARRPSRRSNVSHEIRFERGDADAGFAIGRPGARGHLHHARSTRATSNRWRRSPRSSPDGRRGGLDIDPVGDAGAAAAGGALEVPISRILGAPGAHRRRLRRQAGRRRQPT